MGDLSKADLEGKVVFVRADLNVSGGRRSGRWRSGGHPHRSRPPSAWQHHRCCRHADHLLSLEIIPDTQVPLDGDLKITDDTRIRAAVPTLKYLTDNGAKVG